VSKKLSVYYQEGRNAYLEGRVQRWENPYKAASKQALDWFEGYLAEDHAQKIRLTFCNKVVENGRDTSGLLTLAHYVGIANYDGNLVKVFDLKIQQNPKRGVSKRRLAEKTVTTIRFWDVGGGSQGSGTAEVRTTPFLSTLAAMSAAGVKADLKVCEGIDDEDALFEKLFSAVGELVNVPDRIYNFEYFRVA
jgi:hypothetical protein